MRGRGQVLRAIEEAGEVMEAVACQTADDRDQECPWYQRLIKRLLVLLKEFEVVWLTGKL